MREVRRRRSEGTSGGVSRAGLVAMSSAVEVNEVAAVVWESTVVLVEREDSVRVSVEMVVVCESVVSGASVEASMVVVVDVTTSARRMFMMGTSSAVLMNRSSMEAGKPFAHMRLAFWTMIWTSLSLDSLYMVSSPATTESQTTANRRSIMPFKLGYYDSKTFH